MPNILTIKFPDTVGLAEQTDPDNNTLWLTLFTPKSELTLANAGLGFIYVTDAVEWTWESDVVVPPPPPPVSSFYKVTNPNGMNVRKEHDANSLDIGDVVTNQVLEIGKDTFQGTTYLWGKILSIQNPTPAQAHMLTLSGDKWVALKSSNTWWATEIVG